MNEEKIDGLVLFNYFKDRFNMTDNEAYSEMVKHNQPGLTEVKRYLQRKLFDMIESDPELQKELQPLTDKIDKLIHELMNRRKGVADGNQ